MKLLHFPLLTVGVLLYSLAGCQPTHDDTQEASTKKIIAVIPRENPEGATIGTRFPTPQGYQRVEAGDESFAHYLRTLPLKPRGESVYYYDGRPKSAEGVYLAVVDMEIGKRDLQQCADAVMRLRGEYLYAGKRYDEIHFNFLSDGKPRYYLDRADAARSYKSFRSYMDYVFSYANTGSLHDELIPVSNPAEDIQPGDVFIVKRQPYGHAVIVVDVAVQAESGKRIFLLAQSYMPAQETQILINPNNASLSPWYEAGKGSYLATPEWNFEWDDLRRFPGE